MGVLTFALAMGGVPVAVFAENGGGDDAVSQVRAVEVTTAVRAAETEDEDEQESVSATSSEDGQRVAEEAREQAKQRFEITREMLKDRLEFLFEGTTTPAFSLEQLKQSIEDRKHELDDEEASSTPEVRDIMKNTNPVRMAVHTLLASKELLGGIGPQVSEIARHMNDAVATTTNAEVKIKSRGLFSRFLFGGDKTSAEAISEAVAKNQENIQRLTDLLAQASTTAEVKATIEIQLTALENVQARLQALAEREQKAWGLFSWRF
jgi:hypothetical protein